MYLVVDTYRLCSSQMFLFLKMFTRRASRAAVGRTGGSQVSCARGNEFLKSSDQAFAVGFHFLYENLRSRVISPSAFLPSHSRLLNFFRSMILAYLEKVDRK